MPGLEAPEGCWVGAEREGPLFAGIPWPSHAACYLATLAISAAIRARGLTGRGQHVHTSLMQGAICSTLGAWQRVEHPEVANFQTWITDPRAPKGFFKTVWVGGTKHQKVDVGCAPLAALRHGSVDKRGLDPCDPS